MHEKDYTGLGDSWPRQVQAPGEVQTEVEAPWKACTASETEAMPHSPRFPTRVGVIPLNRLDQFLPPELQDVTALGDRLGEPSAGTWG